MRHFTDRHTDIAPTLEKMLPKNLYGTLIDSRAGIGLDLPLPRP